MTDAPIAPPPDDKDWTWVLERACPECGFDAGSFERDALPAMIIDNADAWQRVLARPDVATRRDPAQWSPLEYGAHVRDVYRLYLYRLNLMLTETDPLYPNWDQDATAVAERYYLSDPAEVAADLAEAAKALAERFADVTDDEWSRTGRRSDGASFTVDTFGRYLIHDPIHHLFDVDG